MKSTPTTRLFSGNLFFDRGCGQEWYRGTQAEQTFTGIRGNTRYKITETSGLFRTSNCWTKRIRVRYIKPPNKIQSKVRFFGNYSRDTNVYEPLNQNKLAFCPEPTSGKSWVSCPFRKTEKNLKYCFKTTGRSEFFMTCILYYGYAIRFEL